MKKKVDKKRATKKKGFFRAAGEMLGSIGHELVEGRDKIVEMSQTVIEGISHTIAPVTKKAAAKKNKQPVKKTTAKKVAKKAAKKTTAKKTVKTIAKSVKKKR